MPVAGPAAVAFEADCFFTDAGVVVPGVAAWVGLAVLAAVVLGAEAFFFVEATGVAGADPPPTGADFPCVAASEARPLR